MNITIIGASGMVGSRLVAEAARRGHRVVAASRNPSTSQGDPVNPLQLDASRPEQLDAALEGADAAVLAVRAAPGHEDTVAPLTTTVLNAAARAHVRLMVIGGAGALLSPGRVDLRVVDDPAYVPQAWRRVAGASVDQLRACTEHAFSNWVYVSPPAILEPGPRTGAYQCGTTTLLTRNGSSRISAEDLAVAAIDELERPGTDQHITFASADSGATGCASIHR